MTHFEVARAAISIIAAHEREGGGAIPESRGGRLDPWDHVECAMALDAGGEHAAAERAYRWLWDRQRDDGSLCSAYLDGVPVDGTRDANLSSYLAVGAWHHYLATRDTRFLIEAWGAVEGALEFALGLQAEDGAVWWARDEAGTPWPDSLVAGASSVRAALRCGEWAANVLGHTMQSRRWADRRRGLESALLASETVWGATLPERTDRYAMHWYYPVLAGIVRDEAARQRLEAGWPRFVVDGLGCRCTDDRGWVTVAETAELALALDAWGDRGQAVTVLEWLLPLQGEDGSFPMGFVPGHGEWPEGGRTTWTAAAVVLAIDACHGLSPAGGLFRALQAG